MELYISGIGSLFYKIQIYRCRFKKKLSYCRLIFDECRNFVLLILSYSWARLYNNTPAITTEVPSADNPVTGLLNNKTESHIRKALFAVFATLEYRYIVFESYEWNAFWGSQLLAAVILIYEIKRARKCISKIPKKIRRNKKSKKWHLQLIKHISKILRTFSLCSKNQ